MSKRNVETRGRKRGKYFVSNEDLVHEIRIYQETGEFTNQLGEYINTIVEGASHQPNFINYFNDSNTWGKEMKSDAVHRVVKSIVENKCQIIPDEELGKPAYDETGNLKYEVDSEGNYVLDDNGDKIEETIKQNNIHGYFSTTISNAFKGRIKTEKSYNEKMEIYKSKVFSDYEHEYGIKPQEEGEYKDEESW